MHRLTRTSRCDETGAAALLVAVMSVLLFGLAALVADLGQARVVRSEAQAASDASALAAGNKLYLAGVKAADVDGAIRAARVYAADNYGITDADWAGCSDPGHLTYTAPEGSGGAATECISLDSGSDPSKIRIVAPVRRSKFVFAPLLGVNEVDISAHAEASLKMTSGADCGLCILGSGTTHDLQNGEARISGADVAINGNVIVKNNGLVITDTDRTILVEGTASGPTDGFKPRVLSGQEPIDDPLASIPLPVGNAGLTVKTNPCATDGTGGPGVYGSLSREGDTCKLAAGLYVITGQWSFTGSASLDATAGVTLYFTCGTTTAPTACNSPGEAGGWLNAAGTGKLAVTAPSTGTYAGLAIAYDRLNTSQLNLSGASGSTYVGTIYGYSSNLRFDGNGCSSGTRSLIVMKELEFNGNNSCLQSAYDQSVNVYVPPDGLHLSR